MHEGFGYWVDDIDDPDGSLAASLEDANAAAGPAARLAAALEATLASDAPLSADERAARAGLAQRQVTIR